jgi:hypothetical protein
MIFFENNKDILNISILACIVKRFPHVMWGVNEVSVSSNVPIEFGENIVERIHEKLDSF